MINGCIHLTDNDEAVNIECEVFVVDCMKLYGVCMSTKSHCALPAFNSHRQLFQVPKLCIYQDRDMCECTRKYCLSTDREAQLQKK